MPKEHRKLRFYYKYFLTFVDVKLYNNLIDEKAKGRKFRLLFAILCNIFVSDVYQNSAKLSIQDFLFRFLVRIKTVLTSFPFVKFEMIHPRSFVFANHHVMQKCMQTCVL